MEIDKNSIFLDTVTIVESLSNCALVAPPPPPEMWSVIERTLNALLKEEEIHPEDHNALNSFRESFINKPEPQTKNGMVSTDSQEYKDYVHSRLVVLLLSLISARSADKEDEQRGYISVAQTMLCQIHQATTPVLRKIVHEWHELKSGKRT